MLTREPLVDPAYSVCPPCPCPPKPGPAGVARDAKLREVNQTRLGTKLGGDPVSFRSKKFTPSEWEKYDLAKYCQALQDCENTTNSSTGTINCALKVTQKHNTTKIKVRRDSKNAVTIWNSGKESCTAKF